MPTADVTLNLVEKDEDNEPSRGDVEVTVTGVSSSTGGGGDQSQLPTIRVEAEDGSYTEEKETGTFLTATFADVPITTLTVTATLSGYKSASKTIDGNDFSS